MFNIQHVYHLTKINISIKMYAKRVHKKFNMKIVFSFGWKWKSTVTVVCELLWQLLFITQMRYSRSLSRSWVVSTGCFWRDLHKFVALRWRKLRKNWKKFENNFYCRKFEKIYLFYNLNFQIFFWLLNFRKKFQSLNFFIKFLKN